MTRSKVLRAVAALVVAATVGLGGPAQAAPIDISLALVSGTLIIPGLPTGPVTLPEGSAITGTWDDETGAFQGDFDIPNTDMGEIIPDSGLCLNIAGSGQADGTVDPITGEGTITTTLTVVMELLLCGGPVGGTCNMGPFDIALSTDPPGSPMAPLPPGGGSQIGLAASGIVIPAVTCSDPSLETLINAVVGLPRQDGSAELVFEVGQVPEPTTTTTAGPTTTAAPAAPAPTQQAQPTFTG